MFRAALGPEDPCFVAACAGSGAAAAREPASAIVGGDEIVEVPPELIVVVVVEAFGGGVPDGSVRPLDLPVGPGMVGAGEAVEILAHQASFRSWEKTAGSNPGIEHRAGCRDRSEAGGAEARPDDREFRAARGPHPPASGAAMACPS
jgi:hypothetical protein